MIYDCFTYSGETDQLTMRIQELGVLDDVKHVAVQGTHTFQGERRKMSPTPDFVRDVMIEQDPHPDVDPWDREQLQRDGIAYGLIDARDDDVVIVSDADEIPAAEHVQHVASYLFCNGGIHALQNITYYYTLDWRVSWEHSLFPVILRVGELRDKGAHKVRHTPNHWRPDAGWHFSYLGGVDAILAKMRAFAHTEFGDLDRDRIEECVNGGYDYDGRGPLIPVEIMPETHPRCIVENPQRWAHLMRERRHRDVG